MVSAGRGESAVSSQERRGQPFGKGHVSGVIGSQIVAEFPDPWEQHIMRIAGDGKISQVFQRLDPRNGSSSPVNAYRRSTCAISTSSKCGAWRLSGCANSRAATGPPDGVLSRISKRAEASMTITDGHVPPEWP